MKDKMNYVSRFNLKKKLGGETVTSWAAKMLFFVGI